MISDISKNIFTHEYLFDFIFNDVMLNELYWRADPSTNCLVNDIQPLIDIEPSLQHTNITVQTNITNKGIYINIYELSSKIGHLSLHLEQKQATYIKSPGALHIRNDTSSIYQLLRLVRYPDSCNPSSINYKLSSINTSKLQIIPPICKEVNITSNIILSVLKQYTSSPIGNPLSLYNTRCSNNTVHPYLMTVIRTRPKIFRTGLTRSLKGGKNKRRTSKVKKYKYTYAKYKTKK